MNEIQKKVFDKLDEMKIEYTVSQHQAMYTIEQMENEHVENMDEVVKNLFIRDDKKERYFLVVVDKDKKVDMKQLRFVLNSRHLSFASEEDLNSFMALSRGSVSPFGVLNDTACRVEVAFDKDLLNNEHVGVHPNQNTATVMLKIKDLEKVVKEHGNKVSYIDIPVKI